MVACDHVAALHPSIGIFVGISSVSPAITKTAAATSVRGGPEADMAFNLNSLTYTKNVAMWSWVIIGTNEKCAGYWINRQLKGVTSKESPLLAVTEFRGPGPRGDPATKSCDILLELVPRLGRYRLKFLEQESCAGCARGAPNWNFHIQRINLRGFTAQDHTMAHGVRDTLQDGCDINPLRKSRKSSKLPLSRKATLLRSVAAG